MKATLLALAMGAATAAAPAIAHDAHVGNCGLHSDYSLSVKPDRLTFKRHSGTPAEVEIADGTLRVDGQLVATDAADQRRLRDAEHEVRALVPEIKSIARDAVGIAFTAIGQVAAAFASDRTAARASAERIERAGRDLRIAEMDSFDRLQDADVDDLMASTIQSVMPELIGNVTAQALKIAFTGDETAAAELEARADGIEKSVDRAVQKQSKELERRAMELCPRLRALDQLESELDFRLADGRRLDLVHVAAD